jgi:hypothetical protein
MMAKTKKLSLRMASAASVLALTGFFAVGIDPFLSAAADQATTVPASSAPAMTVNRAMKGDRLPLVPPAAFTPDQGNRVVPQSQPQAQMPFACDAAFSTIQVRRSANVYRRCMA